MRLIRPGECLPSPILEELADDVNARYGGWAATSIHEHNVRYLDSMGKFSTTQHIGHKLIITLIFIVCCRRDELPPTDYCCLV